jgi:hypothetical protein
MTAKQYDVREHQGISTKIDIASQAESERAKIAVGTLPALGTEPAVMRFLDRIGLLPRGITASAASQEGVIDRLMAAGFRLDVHTLDEKLANTTLSTTGKIMAKARLGQLGLI